jgi:hypothetical protein
VIILALDLSESRVGFCFGEAGTVPKPASFRLKHGKMTTGEAVAEFARWLSQYLTGDDPSVLLSQTRSQIDLVVCEGILPSGAAAGRTTHFVRDGQTMLQGAARAICAVHKVEIRCPPLPTMRKHFCGRAWAPRPKRSEGHQRTSQEAAQDRQATKDMVIQRARERGYIAPDCVDDDAADAAAIFDFASSHFAGVAAGFMLTETT